MRVAGSPLTSAMLLLGACAAAPATPAPPAASTSARLGFEQARALFAGRGVQPGQALPPLRVYDLDGAPVDLAALRAGRPLVVVTASLTCNVARRQQPVVDALRQRWSGRAAVVVVYTIEAHPAGDPCPYTGEPWVPPANERDDVLVRQPTTMAERLVLARRYAADWARGTTVLVDAPDDAAWHALGQAPHLGLLVGADGVVCLRQGWFDGPAIEAELARLLP